MKTKNRKYQQYILFGILTLALYSTLLLSSVQGETIDPSNWRVQTGTTLSYTLDTHTNSNLDTVIDEIAEAYSFDQLGENFWGEPQVELNITSVDTNVSLSQLVESFMDFSAPIGINQLLNESWEQKTSLLLPLAVPMDMWEDLEDEFDDRAEYVDVEHTSVDDYIYTVGWWYNPDQYIYVTFVWSDDSGILNAIFYYVYDGTDSGDGANWQPKETLILRLSNIKTPLNSSNLPTTIAMAIVSIITIILGGVILVLRIRHRKVYLSEITSRTESRFDSQNVLQQSGARQNVERGFTASNYKNDPHFLEGYQGFRRRYLKRWVFFNGISVGILALGTYLLDIIGISFEAEAMIMGTIFGGVFLVGLISYLLNIPLIKLSKKFIQLKVNHQAPVQAPVPFSWREWFKPRFRESQPFMMDPSPLLTFVFCIIGLVMLPSTSDYESITTVGGKLVMIFMGIFLVGLAVLVYLLFPFYLLKTVKKKAMDLNYIFTSDD